jgi:hypothetical protein
VKPGKHLKIEMELATAENKLYEELDTELADMIVNSSEPMYLTNK